MLGGVGDGLKMCRAGGAVSCKAEEEGSEELFADVGIGFANEGVFVFSTAWLIGGPFAGELPCRNAMFVDVVR